MGIDFVFTWYQQKIGAYDKVKWEQRIEEKERSLYGCNRIHTRSAKLNTNFIDLDLVRGSSFTKAKPKHGFIKVTKLATMRCIFYPFYGKWWIKQTSKHVFLICLVLYFLHIINISIYYVYIPSLSCMEVVIPLLMLWILCLIHSQIVATSPSNEVEKSKVKRKQIRKRQHVKKKRKGVRHSENESSDCSFKSEQEINSNQEGDKEGSENRINVECNVESKAKTKTVFNSKRNSVKMGKCKPQVLFPLIQLIPDSNCDSDDEEECVVMSPEVKSDCDVTSTTDWMGVTTNSDCSFSSDMDNISDSQPDNDKDYSVYDNDIAPTAILSPPSAKSKVSCIIWKKNEMKTADLSVVQISSFIIGRVESMPESKDYFYIGLVISSLIALLPVICKLLNGSSDSFVEFKYLVEEFYVNVTHSLYANHSSLLLFQRTMLEELLFKSRQWLVSNFEGDIWEYIVMALALFQRWVLASMIFFLLAVAERTFKQRLLYAKLFSHLTSSRRARKSEIPHFRLNKVINIKTWLSIRSYLKKRGPQRSVDVIVSTAFVMNVLLLTFLCVEVLKETILFSQYYLEALIWCIGLGIFLLRFITLGTNINNKYRSLSVLITEQINLHLQIEQNPKKKDELNVANNVLKSAIDLLKDLENPFKISGLSANPILYNCTKLVILSALSGVFSEMLGFKLKLHKIKLK